MPETSFLEEIMIMGGVPVVQEDHTSVQEDQEEGEDEEIKVVEVESHAQQSGIRINEVL